MAKLPLTDMTPEQFRDWVLIIVEHPLFADRERLATFLMTDADRDTLIEAFREFFEGYYYDVVFELDRHETCLLSILNSCDTYAPLKHRVAIVESKRRASPMGREARRMGSFLSTDSVPQVKVSTLSNRAFNEFLHVLVRSEFFNARERVVKLLSTAQDGTAEPTGRKATDAEDICLRESVYEFFVCHLELEQFLEDYEYDPDEELQIRPEIAQELEQSTADHESGKVKGRPLQEVAKEFGVTLKCTH